MKKILLLLSISALSVNAVAQDVEALFKRANALQDSARFDEAIAIYTSILNTKPDLAGVWQNRGSAYARSGKADLALADLNKALSLKKDLPYAYYWRGYSYLISRKPALAIPEFTESIRTFPSVYLAHYFRGLAYMDLKIAEPPPTLQALTETAYTGKPGDLKVKSINAVNAIADFGQYIQRRNEPLRATSDSVLFGAHYYRAHTYMLEEDFGPAVEDLQKVFDANPNYEEVSTKDKIRNKLGKAKNSYAGYLTGMASPLLVAIAALEGDEPTAQNMAKIEEHKAKARELYAKAAELYTPEIPGYNAYLSRGFAYEYLEKWDKALADYKAVLNSEPSNLYVMRDIAVLLSKTGKKDMAIAEFKKMMSLPQANADDRVSYQIEIARIKAQQNKPDEALAILNTIIKEFPSKSHLYYDRGKLLLQKGNKPAARADFLKAKELCASEEYGYYTLKAAQKELDILDGKMKPPATKQPPAITQTTIVQNSKAATASTMRELTFERPSYKGETLYYKGEIKNGMANGKGEATTSMNHYYKGDFKDNEYHGKGLHKWTNGDTYEGDWVNGQRTGKGLYKWINGQYYDGDFVNGSIAVGSGTGYFYYDNGTYKGGFLNNNRHGKGTYRWTNGDIYVGDWQNGNRTGNGKLTLANGTVQEGTFENNVFKGTANNTKPIETFDEIKEIERAQLAVKEKRYQDAIGIYTFIIQKNGLALAYFERGKIYATLKDYQKAKDDFYGAINIWSTMQTEKYSWLKEDAQKELKKIEKK